MNTIIASSFDKKSRKNGYCSKYFPWLEPNSFNWSAVKREITPEDAVPAHLFWGMPRRIYIIRSENPHAPCTLCNNEHNSLVKEFYTRPGGINYSDQWFHPLSPYNHSEKGLLAIKTPGTLDYKHWLGLVYNDSTNKKQTKTPAKVIAQFLESERIDIASQEGYQYRLWAFGCDIEPGKAKIKCWYEGRMPIINVDAAIRDEYEDLVLRLVNSAKEVASNLKSCVKKAWFKRPGDAKGDTSFIDRSFWSATEPDFYDTLSKLKAELESGNETVDLRKSWHARLLEASIKLFDDVVLSSPIEYSDPKRISRARRDLQKFNHKHKIVTELLGLPKPEKSKKMKKKEVENND